MDSMRVNGYFIGRRGAFVDVEVRSLLLRRVLAIRFHIDIGASTTILAQRDFIRLGGDFSQISRSSTDLFGVGGDVPAYELPSATLAFTTADGGIHTITLPIMLVSNYDTFPPALHARMLTIPSLLGRDIIDGYRFVYDRPINEVFFTDER